MRRSVVYGASKAPSKTHKAFSDGALIISAAYASFAAAIFRRSTEKAFPSAMTAR